MGGSKLKELVLLLCCASPLVTSQLLGGVQPEERAPQAAYRKDDQRFSTGEGRAPLPAEDEAREPGSGNSSRPHIIMLVVDDLGWNDVDWKDNGLHTPVLTGLAKQGVVLNQSYVQPVCSPSRAAFLSGFYPYHLGLQHDSLRATQQAYMPANVTTLPQHLKKLGYHTHMAGKWHLGFCNWKYTPTYRGFDSFVGYYNAIEDYYTHIGHHNGYDFRYNEDVFYEANGTYSAFIFTQYIEKVIAQHNPSEPLFVYLPYQSVHGPLQVPQEYIDKFCSHYKDKYRRIKCGMIALLDEGVGNITRALQQKGMFNDTVLLVTTDNGGPVHEGANNWPLRGSKTTLWEGGTRALAFLHAPRFLKNFTGSVYNGVIHAVDWLPTLVEAAGGQAMTGLDGVSQWQSLLHGKVPSARTEFIYNIDEMKNNSALRMDNFKLIQGPPGHPDKWYPPPPAVDESVWTDLGGERASAYPGETGLESLAGYSWLESFGEEELDAQHSNPQQRVSYERLRLIDILSETRLRDSDRLSTFFQRILNYNLVSRQGRDADAAVVGMTSVDDVTAAPHDPYQLYDLKADPTEHHDVKDKYPEVFQKMRARLAEYRKSLVPANFPAHDPAALPSNYNGVWSPGWC